MTHRVSLRDLALRRGYHESFQSVLLTVCECTEDCAPSHVVFRYITAATDDLSRDRASDPSLTTPLSRMAFRYITAATDDLSRIEASDSSTLPQLLSPCMLALESDSGTVGRLLYQAIKGAL